MRLFLLFALNDTHIFCKTDEAYSFFAARPFVLKKKRKKKNPPNIPVHLTYGGPHRLGAKAEQAVLYWLALYHLLAAAGSWLVPLQTRQLFLEV